MQLLDSQEVILSVSGKDKAGNPVAIPGQLVWTVSDENIASLTDNGDGTQTLATTGELGSVVVTVSDDVEGDGTPDFQGSLAVDVVAGPVTEIEVAASEPTDRA